MHKIAVGQEKDEKTNWLLRFIIRIGLDKLFESVR